MTTQERNDTARILVAGGKGLLAMDESNGTCDERFADWGIPQTEAARHAYRELITTTPHLAECISGVILYDETIREQRADGTTFVKLICDAGIIPGIKVDTGAILRPCLPSSANFTIPLRTAPRYSKSASN